MKKLFTYILIFCLVSLIAAGCGKGSGRRAKEKEEIIPVRVMKVKNEDVNKVLEYVGNIKGRSEAIVYPKVNGKIIEKVKEDGSLVNKGDVIAYIDRDEVGLTFEKAPVESPLTGMVGRVYVDIGSSVTPQTAIALVTNMDKADIVLSIPEKYLPKVLLGQEAKVIVDAYPNKQFTGQVVKISPVLDMETRSAPIEIEIDNADHRLQSGMFAQVELTIEENRNAPVILKEAVIGKNPNTYVYVVEGKKASLRKIGLGIRKGPYYEVTDGLKEGQYVVIMGQQRLRDGASVEPEE